MITVLRCERIHRARQGKPAKWLTLDIGRPETSDLLNDPAIIAGCKALAQRVLVEALLGALSGRKEDEAFFLVPDPESRLQHWVTQAGLGMSLSVIRRKVREALKDPALRAGWRDRRRGPLISCENTTLFRSFSTTIEGES